MIDLEQLKADREAGTDGPWQVSGARHKGDLRLGPDARLHMVGPDNDAVSAVFFSMKTGLGWHDARRIARLPDLEAAYIEVIAKLDKAVEAFSEAMEENEQLKEALWDSVDKATKMQGNEK